MYSGDEVLAPGRKQELLPVRDLEVCTGSNLRPVPSAHSQRIGPVVAGWTPPRATHWQRHLAPLENLLHNAWANAGAVKYGAVFCQQTAVSGTSSDLSDKTDQGIIESVKEALTVANGWDEILGLQPLLAPNRCRRDLLLRPTAERKRQSL